MGSHHFVVSMVFGGCVLSMWKDSCQGKWASLPTCKLGREAAVVGEDTESVVGR